MAAGTVITLILAVAMAGCATFKHQTQTSIQDLKEADRPDISTSIDGSIPVKHLAEKQVYVNFKNSEKLTKVLASIVEINGGRIAPTADQAELILEAYGAFAAARPAGKRVARADVGMTFEKGGEVSSRERSFDIIISPGGPLLSAVDASALLSGLNALSDITGISAWFNNLLTGDPDGICFSGCEYKQAVVIAVDLKDRDGMPLGESQITSKTEHRKLWPVPMIEAALNKLSDAWLHSE